MQSKSGGQIGRLLAQQSSPRAARLLLGRGVWQVPWLSPNGRPVYVMIDSQHREMERVELADGQDPVALECDMNARLDTRDPPPRRLQIVQ